MTGLGPTLLSALVVALILGAVAHRLRMPSMIGYVAAGFVVGPLTPGLADEVEVLELADIGVALLMFSIGLRFSVGELLSAGRAMMAGTPIQVGITMALGTAVGLLLGWELLEALFIGASVSVCSTVVMVKLAGEEALHTTPHGRAALSISIVQDLVTVFLVVVLSALAADGGGGVGDVAAAAAIALGFIAVIVVVGSRALPPLLSAVARLGSRELFIIAVAVMAIGTAFAASALGVSVALGAFVAGLALADSDLTASVLGEIVPLRELFATFFFVSIGMILEPSALLEGLPVVIALLLIISLGKLLPVAGLAWAGGNALSSSVRTGGMLAQSGEFSFVLASAGLGLGAVSQETFSVAMGAVVVSILAAGPIVWVTDRVAVDLERHGHGRRPLPGEPPDTSRMRRHAVILGYGRVGRLVARTIDARGFAWVAVDGDYGIARTARLGGAPIIYGDASSPTVLDETNVADAHTLIVAIPDALAGVQAVRHARQRNPRIEIVARAHSDAEEAELRRLGADRVVVAERELGNELLRHALRRFGVSDREVGAMLERRRT